MKLATGVLGLMVGALSCSLMACNRRKIEPQPIVDASANGSRPKLVVAETEHAFGFVVVGQPREHTFLLKNEGSAPLVLADVSAACSCAVAELTERQLNQGASTKLTVRYRPNALTGPDRQTLRVTSNDPDRPLLELVVTAMVVPEIRFEPPQLRLQTHLTEPKDAVSELRGNAVIRANLHLAELRGDPKAISQVRVTVQSGPYDVKRRPRLSASLKNPKATPGQVLAVVLTGLPDPTQILVPIEWGTEPIRE